MLDPPTGSNRPGNECLDICHARQPRRVTGQASHIDTEDTVYISSKNDLRVRLSSGPLIASVSTVVSRRFGQTRPNRSADRAFSWAATTSRLRGSEFVT